MANFMVLRLIPPAALAPADFTTNLTNLTLNVYDVSYEFAGADGTNDEQRTIVSNVAYPDVNTREDVLFVNEHSIDDMRDYLVAHSWMRGAQPSKGHLVGQLLAAFLLS